MPRPWVSLLVLIAVFPARAAAQRADPELQAVLATTHRMFEGMRAGDSAAIRSVFHPGAALATVLNPPAGPELRVDTLEAFIRAVGTPHDEVWDERVAGEEVRIDGALATVWSEYSFYAGARFSHCGVNAFQLARTAKGWQIIALTDTRRRDGCRDAGGG